MAQIGATEIQQVGESNKTESANAKRRKPPLNFLAILKDIVPPIDTSSVDKLCDQLYSGVFVKPNRLKYWVDKELNKNCFALYARELKITWGEDSRYWTWTKEKEASGEEIEVAELLEVWWLEVIGTFRTTDLSPKTVYEVVYVIKIKNSVIKMKNSSTDLVFPVELTFVLPNNNEQPTWRRQRGQASLEKMPLEKWIEIKVGEFEMSPENVGQVEFRLENVEGKYWKTGLLVKCVTFRPKKE